MFNALLRITDNCNLRCGHCYGGFGPGGKTMTKKAIAQVINNLPFHTTLLGFSGGEVSTRMGTLKFSLEYARTQRPRLFPNAALAVETNGSWITDEASTFSFISKVKSWGAERIYIAGKDKYHEEQGLNISSLSLEDGPLAAAVLALSKDSDNPPITIVLGGARDGAMPFGRGATLPIGEQRIDEECSVCNSIQYWPHHGEINIAPSGQVYLCNWAVGPSIGSALQEPVHMLMQRASGEDSITMALRLEGPFAAARKAHLPIPTDLEEINERACRDCHAIFSAARQHGLIL